MTKEEVLNYLEQKKNLTAGVQNARHELFESNGSYTTIKKQFKKRLILLIVAGIFVPMLLNNLIGETISVLCWAAVIFLIYTRFQQGGQLKEQIRLAERKLQEEQSQPAYVNGMKDFPQKFYNYWAIDRLIHLVQENRATTLQEAFNVAETQDFQNDQILLQQQNLATAESTNTMSKVSAVANVVTAFHTRKR